MQSLNWKLVSCVPSEPIMVITFRRSGRSLAMLVLSNVMGVALSGLAPLAVPIYVTLASLTYKARIEPVKDMSYVQDCVEASLFLT